jgi:hypothetical protein
MPTTFTTPFSFSTGQIIQAGQHNDNWIAAKDYFDALSSGANFVAGAITSDTIGTSAVTTVKIQDDAVTQAKLADDAVGTAQILNDAVTAAKIATGAVGTSEIAASVTLTTPNIGAATGTSLTLTGGLTATGNVIGHIATNAQTGTTYTLVAADDGKAVEILNASPITLTVPLNSSVPYTVGTQIVVLQTGAGQITVAGAGGVTVNATPGLKLRAQWSSATLIKRATDTWVLVGDLSA